MRCRIPFALSFALFSAACTGGEGGGSGSGCGSAEGTLPGSLVELSYDDGEPEESVRTAGFNDITVGETGNRFDLAEEPLWEAVRFELDRPARVHGMTVTFANFDGSSGPPFEIGLFPDFGRNGVDYWRDNPHWIGDRCASDVAPGEPVEFVLEEPIDFAKPALVYVAHRAPDPADPTLAFDGSVAGGGTCASWDECHSSLNMPDADADVFYQGVSLSFPYDYLVRLHVEYPEAPPAQKVFTLQTNSGITGTALHSSWGDYDNDGWEDVLTSEIGFESKLWRNQGDGTFVDVSAASGLSATYPRNVDALGTWGDYDNDGCLDLYFYSQYTDFAKLLMRSNCDGTFTDVSAAAGVTAEVALPHPCPPTPQTQSATWIDIDGDSFLDLYLANYNCGFGGYVFEDDVFRNRGDGTFEDWYGTHGFLDERLNGRGTEAIDYDQDGDTDLLVHNYVLDPNRFYRNLGNGTVEEIGMANGLAGDETVVDGRSYFGHTLGVAWGDIDNDGDFDAVEANLAHPRFFHFSDRTRVLLQDAETGFFFDVAGGASDLPLNFAGIEYQEAYTSPALADFDLDGDLDLAISSRYEYTGRVSDFYWGNGDGTFELDTYHALPKLTQGWGLSVADYDHDGDPDLMTREGLLRNDGVHTGHWLAVRATGNVRSNRAAIGATIRVYAGGRVMPGWVPGSSSQGSQDTQSVHFGLGAIDVVDGIEVLFPGGRAARYDGPFAADQHVRVYEDGTITFGW